MRRLNVDWMRRHRAEVPTTAAARIVAEATDAVADYLGVMPEDMDGRRLDVRRTAVHVAVSAALRAAGLRDTADQVDALGIRVVP